MQDFTVFWTVTPYLSEKSNPGPLLAYWTYYSHKLSLQIGAKTFLSWKYQGLFWTQIRYFCKKRNPALILARWSKTDDDGTISSEKVA